MSFIYRFTSWFFGAYGILGVTSLVFCAIIWFLGPIIGIGGSHPFETISARLITIGIILALTLFIMLIIALVRARRERNMTEEIVEQEVEDVDETDETVKAELAEMKTRMAEALKLLRKSKLGGKGRSQKLYQLPWYLMIGPPGSGKTTAIVNSGLTFPLAEKMGMQAVGGIGGTRNCDWWFTDEAVLIDTAGRYTTQDSDADADSRAWNGFLNMLKKYRKRQPINGAIVAISLSDISTQDEAARKEYATAIRLRLTELREKLGVRFPIYLMLTKADLIVGFMEFFENLGKEARSRVWGFTYPMENARDKRKPLDGFDEQFDALMAQLNNHKLERMSEVTDPGRRAMIAGFPQQVASLRPVVREFLTDIFLDSKFMENQLVRGMYLTSGTQEGTPIDRLLGGMAKTFGLGRQALGSGAGQGRSYFLKNLLDDVLFPEAGLVSKDDKVERRFKWIVRGTVAAATIGTLAMVGIWVNSFLGNRALVAEASEQAEAYASAIATVPGNPIEDTNVSQLVLPLNILLGMPSNPRQTDPEPDRALTYGLYQGSTIGTQSAQTYRTAMNQMMLPRMILKLEEQMHANMGDTGFLFEALKIYLMLGQQGPMDVDRMKEWYQTEWGNEFGTLEPDLYRGLMVHLENMVTQPMISVPLDGDLVEQIQEDLAEIPVAERAYRTIVDSQEAKTLATWTVQKAGGPATPRVMQRPSGLQLTDGVPGIYTHDGFYDVFLPAALDVAAQLQKDNWVLGPRAEDLSDPNALALIARDVLDLYYADYIIQWETILGDVDIQPMSSMSQTVNALNLLSGPTSPLRNILDEVATQTKLATRASSQVAEQVGEGLGAEGTNLAIEGLGVRTQRLLAVLQTAATANGEEPPKPGQVVEDRFDSLNTFVNGIAEGAPGEMDRIMELITGAYQELNRLSVGGGNVAGSGEAVLRLQEANTTLSGPMQRWITQIIEGASGAAAGGKRSKLNNQWQANVLPYCKQGVENRYPFNRKARAEIGVQDFARLFAPNGLIDGFFNSNLAEHVDTSARPWKFIRSTGKDLGISDNVLQQFEIAAEIRDAFFLAPGLPSVTFDLKPIALDPNAQQVTLVVNGQTVAYAHGPQQTTSLKWPEGGGSASVSFEPAAEGRKNARQVDGPWAWFRMLDTAEVRRTNVADQTRVVFNVGGRIAVFNMRAGSAINPFSSKAVRRFRCPGAL